MKLLLSYMPFLLCAGAMVACKRMMGGGSRDEKDRAELTKLREEVARLRALTPTTSGKEPATRE